MSQSNRAAAQVVTLAYVDAPTGAVVATEAALKAILKTRPWALVFAILLLLYAAAGGTIGTIWLVVLLTNQVTPGTPLGQFIVGSTFNLVCAPIALVGGILAILYFRAAGRAYARRGTDELERAMTAQLRVWRWAAVALTVLLGMPLIVIGLAIASNAWP